MATARYTIIYERDRNRYKLVRVLIGNDGSYYVTCPYHVSEKVSLTKRSVNYPNPDSRAEDAPTKLAVLEDDDHRLKLSHHPDGFVQFSGHGVRSGKHEDGTPKGLGLQSFPLDRPTAGPAVGVTILGPTAFEVARKERPGDLVFRQADMLSADTDTGLIVELYYFAGLWRRFVRVRDGAPTIQLRHPSGANIELRVCPGPSEPWGTGFIGVDVWSAPIKFGDAASGFAMSSPTQLVGRNERGELEAQALIASYPGIPSAAAPFLQSIAFPVRDDPAYVVPPGLQ